MFLFATILNFLFLFSIEILWSILVTVRAWLNFFKIHIINLYFPLLSSNNDIFSLDLLEKNKKKLIQNTIEKINDNMLPEEIQTIVYSVGKENGYEKNLRDWFKLIYQVLFGDIDGPRMGFFISFFGIQETIKLIKDKIN